MKSLALGCKPHGETTIDVCEGCHALWFDAFESVQLMPAAILELFRAVNAAKPPARRSLPSTMACPRCRRSLAETNDIRHSTRFTYWRCAQGHGRLTPFVQFLREKDFVRPLSPAEIERLRMHIRTIRCSGCGAAVDLKRDMVCSFCRSPIEALDPKAVAETLGALASAEAKRKHVDVDALADAILASQRQPVREPWSLADFDGAAADLVTAGASLLLRGSFS